VITKHFKQEGYTQPLVAQNGDPGLIMNVRSIVLFILCCVSMPGLAVAQTDEIQVYDGEIAPPGTFNLMIHNNFTPQGWTSKSTLAPSSPIIVSGDRGVGLRCDTMA
jgi:hypothetical protein